MPSPLALALALVLAVVWALPGCRCSREASQKAQAPRGSDTSLAPVGAPAPAGGGASAADLFAQATVTGAPPPGAPSVAEAVQQVLVEAQKPNLGALEALALPSSVARLRRGVETGPLPLMAVTLEQKLRAPVRRVEYLGGRAAVQVQGKGLTLTTWFYWRDGRWRIDLADTRPLEPAWPGPADPQNRPVSLAEAASGVQGQGALGVVFDTPLGSVRCTLHAEVVPELVAHFAGLVSGARASREFEGRTLKNVWVHRPFYQGTPLHRSVPGKRIEGGDPIGKGTGHAGFRIADQLDLRLRHDRPGVLGLVTLGPHSASSMFYLTLSADPDLDDRYLPFGWCGDLPVLERLSRQPAGAVTLQQVRLVRGVP